MQMLDKLEKSYSDFIDSEEYEKLLEKTDLIFRPTFIAGWNAAVQFGATYELLMREET